MSEFSVVSSRVINYDKEFIKATYTIFLLSLLESSNKELRKIREAAMR